MLIEREGNSIIEATSSNLEMGFDLSPGKDSEIAFSGLHKKKKQLWGGLPTLTPSLQVRERLCSLKGAVGLSLRVSICLCGCSTF